MLVAILGTLLAAGMAVVLAVVAGRRDRRERLRLGLDLPPRPDPPLVDRAFDPARCAYCDEATRYRCRACDRAGCEDHRPRGAERFCYECDREWRAGAGRRGWLITGVVLATMFATLLTVAGLMAAFDRAGIVSSRLALAALVAPLLIAAPTYLAIERQLRRRFRPVGQVPRATVRR
ncbi:MAG: hypothetical protein H6709_07000 [Kofleriaceae bacterium]|nr:hypothetical protein [Myxococcales bacterium]MCB9560122.1 hypothetical protein [Kofleriaceae bacterium]MCB9571825.1 hypothetical protein [Kofleriaceae bacterium]